MRLRWEDIDLAGRMIHLSAEVTKEGMPKRIPLTKALRDMRLKMPDRGRIEFVFTFYGKTGDIREGLKAAGRASQIVYGRSTKRGFGFHDLRHCFSTYARRADIPRNVIKAIMSQSTGGDMNARYDLVEDADLLRAVDRLEKYLSANLDLNLDLNEKTT